MTTSGTTSFAPSNSAIVFEAFDRLGMRPSELDRHHMMSARSSLNYELLSFSNQGMNLWKVIEGTIALVPEQAVYQLPTTLITMVDMIYSAVDLVTGQNTSDRPMTPLMREQYVQLPQKKAQGQPTSFWFQRLEIPQVTIWPVPVVGAPQYVCDWFGLSQIEDANLGGGETPDVVYRGVDALCAKLAVRLAVKFKPAKLGMMKAEAREAWDAFALNDQEEGALVISPNLSSYGRIG